MSELIRLQLDKKTRGKDITGSLDGTYTYTPVFVADYNGTPNGASYITGSTDNTITIPDIYSVANAKGIISFSVWLKPDSLPTAGDNSYMINVSNGTNLCMGMRFTGVKIGMISRSKSTDALNLTNSASNPLSAGWSHFVFLWKFSTKQVAGYLNVNNFISLTSAPTWSDTKLNLASGSSFITIALSIPGAYCDFRMFDHQLTTEEMQALYDAKTTGFVPKVIMM